MCDRKKKYYVYILASKKHGTLYIGVTSRLAVRVIEHRLKMKTGFAEKYDVLGLVYFEMFDYADRAIYREKQIKKWNRKWKIRLIEKENKDWKDLLPEIADEEAIRFIIDMLTENKGLYPENMDPRQEPAGMTRRENEG